MSAIALSSYERRQQWRAQQFQTKNAFVTNMPKVELHVHIEGTMTPSLRWKLAQRNSLQLFAEAQTSPLTSLEEVEDAYRRIRGRIGAASADSSKSFTFFEA
jgi:adenosine deaminase